MEIRTPHIIAKKGDFAKTVLMPGDPLRAKKIAEIYLENPRLVNEIRGTFAFTGTYKGKEISIMASGMGIPSMGIYSHELFDKFDVERIIRIGTAGTIQEDINLKDIVIAMGVSTDSNFMSQYNLKGTYSAIADYSLLEQTVDTAKEMQMQVKVGNILTSDVFYNDSKDVYDNWSKMGILAVEMESLALYANAAKFKKKALTICTISDQLIRDEHCTAEERQTSFSKMMELALNVGIKD